MQQLLTQWRFDPPMAFSLAAFALLYTRGWLLPGLACAALYFAMSYPLARLARRWERRLGGG